MASGCDNVAWGGVDMHLEPPPSHADLMAAEPGGGDPDEGHGADRPALPAGPLLLAGTRSGSSATLVVVGEIGEDGLVPLPAQEEAPGLLDRVRQELLAPGSEFLLFSQGVRVGRLVATGHGVDDRFCAPRPSVSGRVELTPSAAGAQRLLALPTARAGSPDYGEYETLDHTYEQRVASLDLAGQAIPLVSAPWPPSLLESRADIQAFRLQEDPEPAIAATFLYQDRLAVGEPGDRAYSLFLVGAPDSAGPGYERAFTWYRRADDEGKGAPRYFAHLDWDRDGRSEILLDVLGAESRWFAALGRDDGSWARTFQDPCGTAPSSTPG